jgi:tetratricopeptide (TPR) repeat protein
LGYDFSGLRDVDSRAAALRGVLVERRVLLIVDDVWEAGAARALLVGGPASATLLTTRNLDLAVALGAQVVSLPVLALDESLQLFRRILGPKRVEAEAQAAADIAQLLMHHPLALEIAARRLVSRPRWQLADLAERLRDEKQRLNELSIGDKAVRASFTISWEALDPILRQTFTHLAVFEGRAFTAPALAAVAELDKRQAADRLGLLAALSWVTEEGTVHYRQHLLLADFARERLSQDPAESAASFIRMADYYLQFARKRPTAYAELEAEWDNLTAGMRVAHEHGQWQTVLDYADALNGPWFTCGHFSDARQGYARACAAARALNDQHALAQQLCLWGRACIEQSDYAEAEEYLKESLGIGRLFTEQALAGDALYYLGWLEAERANYSTSQAHLQASRAIREQLGDSAGIAATLHREAKNYYELGQYAEAKHLGQRVLDNAAAVQIKTHIKTLRVLADVHMAEKDYIQAEALSQTALQLCEASQDRIELALVLYSLATIAHYQNLASVAQTYAERSLEIFIRIGDRKSQAQVLYLLGANYADQGDYAGAFKVGQHSLQLCQELEDVWGMIYVRLFLGGISKQLHDPAGAHAQWQIALTQAEGLTASHPLVETLRERLTSLV